MLTPSIFVCLNFNPIYFHFKLSRKKLFFKNIAPLLFILCKVELTKLLLWTNETNFRRVKVHIKLYYYYD